MKPFDAGFGGRTCSTRRSAAQNSSFLRVNSDPDSLGLASSGRMAYSIDGDEPRKRWPIVGLSYRAVPIRRRAGRIHRARSCEHRMIVQPREFPIAPRRAAKFDPNGIVK